MCANCGHIQSCEVRNIHKYVFKCRRCGKSRKLKKKTEIGLSLKHWGPFKDAYTTTQCCIKIKEQLRR